MTLLQHELTDFKVNAFQNNEFHEVTKEDVLGHWSRHPLRAQGLA